MIAKDIQDMALRSGCRRSASPRIPMGLSPIATIGTPALLPARFGLSAATRGATDAVAGEPSVLAASGQDRLDFLEEALARRAAA